MVITRNHSNFLDGDMIQHIGKLQRHMHTDCNATGDNDLNWDCIVLKGSIAVQQQYRFIIEPVFYDERPQMRNRIDINR